MYIYLMMNLFMLMQIVKDVMVGASFFSLNDLPAFTVELGLKP